MFLENNNLCYFVFCKMFLHYKVIVLCSSEINIIANVKHIRVVPKFAILWQNHIPVNVNVLTTSMISNDINKQSTLAINI